MRKLATHLWRREARVEWWVCFLSNWSLTILYICSQSGLLCPLPTSANALFWGGIFTHWETPVRAGVSAFWQLVSNNSIHLCCTGLVCPFSGNSLLVAILHMGVPACASLGWSPWLRQRSRNWNGQLERDPQRRTSGRLGGRPGPGARFFVQASLGRERQG